MEVAKITVECIGPVAKHNMPCGVCRLNHAVLNLGNGVMEPCWSCQKEGYRLLKFEKGSLISFLINFVYGKLEFFE